VETLASKIAHHQALTDLDATGWIIRLAKGLEPIHALGVAHGNITAEAVRIDGLARASRGVLADARHLRDLPAYHSPERIDGEGASVADDTWAAAVTLYVALTGSLPFPGAHDGEVRGKNVGAPAAPLAVFDVGDDGLQQILDRAFARDAAERLTSIRELRQALEEWHPDPDVKKLRPLDDEEDGEPAGGELPTVSLELPTVSLELPTLSLELPTLSLGTAPQRYEAGARAPVAPPAAMSADRLLSANDEEDGPTQVRGDSAVHQYLEALQASAAPVAAPPTALPSTAASPTAASPTAASPNASSPNASSPTASSPNATPPTALPPSAFTPTAAPSRERGSRLRRLPAPTPPPVRQSPSVAPGPMGRPALATAESPPAERPGPARAGLFDDEEATMFVPPSSTARVPPVPSSPAKATSAAAMFPSATPPIAPSNAPSNGSTGAPSSAAHAAHVNDPHAGASKALGAEASNAAFAASSNALAGEPAPSSEPQGRSRSRTPLLAGLAVLLAGGVAGFLLVSSQRPPDQAASGASTPLPLTAPPASGAAAASATPSAAAIPPPSAAASASSNTASAPSSTASASSSTASAAASASSSAAAGPSPNPSPSALAACLMPAFAAGTFVAPPTSLGSLCAITDPRKGGEAVRIEVILGSAGRGVSDGMREWGVLGLYEMAAFAVLRSTCCPSAPPLEILVHVPTCDIKTALNKLAEVAGSASASDAELDSALAAYTTQARCISRAGASTAFGIRGRLQGGELETFQKTLDRARAVVKKR